MTNEQERLMDDIRIHSYDLPGDEKALTNILRAVVRAIISQRLAEMDMETERFSK